MCLLLYMAASLVRFVHDSISCRVFAWQLPVGYTQTINAVVGYYDSEIDAINEPFRPIPSGGKRVQCLGFVSMAVSVGLGCAAP
jgi:chlorophyll synthase